MAKAPAKPKAPRRKPGPKRNVLTVARVEAALRAGAGFKSLAANMLGVHKSSITRFVQAHPQLNDVIDEISEELLDIAETKLIGNIRDGETNAIRYYLDAKGGVRGYGRKVQVSGPDGGPIQTQAVDDLDYSKLSVEEMEALEAIREKAARAG